MHSLVSTLASESSAVRKPISESETQTLLASKSELPASFEVLDQALDLMRKPECTNERLQEVLMNDPASVADVTRLANSAYFGVPGRIRTVATAIRVVGHRRLETLLRHLMIGKLFELLRAENPAADAVNEAAMGAGAAAGEIAHDWSVEESDALRLACLVHNLGELVLISAAPQLYDQARGKLDAGYPDGDLRHFGMTFPQATAWLLRKWKFPDEQVRAVEVQRTLEGVEEAPAYALCFGLHIASRLAGSWALERTPDQAQARLSPMALRALNLDEDRVFACYAAIPAETERLRSWLGG